MESLFNMKMWYFRSVKKCIQFLECSWNREYFRSLAKLMCEARRASLTLHETQSIHDSMKIEFINYIYILYYQSSINFQFSSSLAGFPYILN